MEGKGVLEEEEGRKGGAGGKNQSRCGGGGGGGELSGSRGILGIPALASGEGRDVWFVCSVSARRIIPLVVVDSLQD